MAGKYRCIFMKTFKKNIDDGLFSFIIVDSVNDKTDHFREMWSYAKQKGFEVQYFTKKGTCGANVSSVNFGNFSLKLHIYNFFMGTR